MTGTLQKYEMKPKREFRKNQIWNDGCCFSFSFFFIFLIGEIFALTDLSVSNVQEENKGKKDVDRSSILDGSNLSL